MPRKMTREEVANTIQQFLDGTGGKWDWDDFCSFEIADPESDAIRERCISNDEFPSKTGYCDERGYRAFCELIERLL